MTDNPDQADTTDKRHAVDLDVHLHVPLSELSELHGTPAGHIMADHARVVSQGDPERARAVLLRSAIRSVIAGDYVQTIAMIEGLAITIQRDTAALLQEAPQ